MIYLFSKSDSSKNILVKDILDNYSIKLIDLEYLSRINTLKTNDILILDIDEFNSLDNVLEYFKLLPKKLKVIAFIQEPHLAHGALLIKKGFKSYIGKDTNKDVIKIALDSVLNGNVWLYPQLMNFIIKHISIDSNEQNSSEVLERLSDKEQNVALLVADGLSNKEIAEILDVQLVTIKKHISHIFGKLEIKDRLSLALLINQ